MIYNDSFNTYQRLWVLYLYQIIWRSIGTRAAFILPPVDSQKNKNGRRRVFHYLALFFVELFFVQYDFSVFFCNYRNFSSTTEINVPFFLILVTYKRVVGCSPPSQRFGPQSGCRPHQRVPTETHNPDQIEVLTPLRTNDKQ